MPAYEISWTVIRTYHFVEHQFWIVSREFLRWKIPKTKFFVNIFVSLQEEKQNIWQLPNYTWLMDKIKWIIASAVYRRRLLRGKWLPFLIKFAGGHFSHSNDTQLPKKKKTTTTRWVKSDAGLRKFCS